MARTVRSRAVVDRSYICQMCNDYEQHARWSKYRKMMQDLELGIPSPTETAARTVCKISMFVRDVCELLPNCRRASGAERGRSLGDRGALKIGRASVYQVLDAG
jgi:hypothetical protein